MNKRQNIVLLSILLLMVSIIFLTTSARGNLTALGHNGIGTDHGFSNALFN